MPARKRFAENVPGLLLRPMNLDTRRIFVAATRMNDGKTPEKGSPPGPLARKKA